MSRIKNGSCVLCALLVAVAWQMNAFAQVSEWSELRGKQLAKFDDDCTETRVYSDAKLDTLVKTTLKRLGRDTYDPRNDAQPSRAFRFDLDGDNSPEYFVPITCGATGNCNFGIFATKPDRFLGIVNGERVYVHTQKGGWPVLITYGNLNAFEGELDTWVFSKGRYFDSKKPYYIGDPKRTDNTRKVVHAIPGFLEQGQAGCKDLGK
jgi:hypothetical protein